MLLSDTHLKILLSLNKRFGESYEFELEDDTLAIYFNRYTVSTNYERYVNPDGTIFRYDGDTNTNVPATFEPCTGTFRSRTGKTTTYYY